MAYTPKRGDAVWITMDPQAGVEQAGRRPAIVLSPRSYNGKVGLVIVCPITRQEKGYPFEVKIPQDLHVSGVILADQARNLDWRARKASYICKLPSDIVTETLGKLYALISVNSMHSNGHKVR